MGHFVAFIGLEGVFEPVNFLKIKKAVNTVIDYSP